VYGPDFRVLTVRDRVSRTRYEDGSRHNDEPSAETIQVWSTTQLGKSRGQEVRDQPSDRTGDAHHIGTTMTLETAQGPRPRLTFACEPDSVRLSTLFVDPAVITDLQALGAHIALALADFNPERANRHRL
jgi:hypothetical protein